MHFNASFFEGKEKRTPYMLLYFDSLMQKVGRHEEFPCNTTKGHHTLLTRQHCCWKLLLATMFPRYFASKFAAELPAVVTFGVMNNNYITLKASRDSNELYYRAVRGTLDSA